MSFPKKILIQECCPRDGWQNHKEFIPTQIKIKYIKKMIDCGAKLLELTSFVNPKVMPQMVDAKEVFDAVRDYAKENGVTLSALTLNKHGVDDARAAGIDTVEFVMSASQEHNLRNSRRTIQESMDIFKELAAHSDGLDMILCVPCVFGSPFGDEIPMERIRWIIDEAHSVGVERIGLADTAGISTPQHTRDVLRYVAACTDINNVGVHFHDTHGMGLANSFVALEEGIVRHDSSLAAMGGCPFSPGAKGNIATEDIVNMCAQMDIATSYDLENLIRVAHEMCGEIHTNIGGSMALACHP